MIESNTVLVLGAGASAPFGFPVGQALKDQVCKELSTPQPIHTLELLGFKKEETDYFKDALINSGRSSVDAFLEYREDFLDIGKAAIAIALLPYETTSSLFKDWIQKREKPDLFPEGNWYDLLFGTLTDDGVTFDEFDKNKLNIITFNYDRSLEHYLFTSLKNSYNKPDDECGEKLREIEVVHVHGSLGPLDWQARPTGLSSVPYDSGIDPKVVKLAAENIKIVHEGVADTPEFIKAHALLLTSTKIFFLGFGYHPVNLKRLRIGTLEIPHDNIMGTSLGLSYKRRQNIKRFKPKHILYPNKVYTFLYKEVIF